MKQSVIRTLPTAVAAIVAILSGPAAQAHTPAAGCWHRPGAQTLEEIAVRAANRQRRHDQAAATHPGAATLALSNPMTVAKAAYGAGLLVGWGETGNRPEFSTVTAVGASALVAPFAFIGAAGDQKIADLFVCRATSFAQIAERAAAGLDAATMAAIARKHQAGGRLLVALPRSAARKATVWNLGSLAAEGTPQARDLMRRILLAAVDLTTFIDPATAPVPVGSLTERNLTFRQLGAGEPFLHPGDAHPRATFLIHNGVLFPDETISYMADRKAILGAPPAQPRVVAAYDFFQADAARTDIFVASPRPRLPIRQSGAFDAMYLRALFEDSYRQGIFSREWRRTLVDTVRSYMP